MKKQLYTYKNETENVRLEFSFNDNEEADRKKKAFKDLMQQAVNDLEAEGV